MLFRDGCDEGRRREPLLVNQVQAFLLEQIRQSILFFQKRKSEVTRYFLHQSQVNPKFSVFACHRLSKILSPFKNRMMQLPQSFLSIMIHNDRT
jgi:hypothetical protein